MRKSRTPSSQNVPDMRLYIAALVMCLLFLQEGFNYYLSFQILALVLMVGMVARRITDVHLSVGSVLTFVSFVLSFLMTALLAPQVIARNSPNIALVTFGMLMYAGWIYFVPRLTISDSKVLMHALQKISMSTIFILMALMAISETNAIPLLSRDAFLIQNSRLIDNFADIEAISNHREMLEELNQQERIDLFYGEPSFLAIVIFTCAVAFTLSRRFLSEGQMRSYSTADKKDWLFRSVIFTSIWMLLYLQSLSSIIYALLIMYFLILKGMLRQSKWWTNLIVLVGLATTFTIFSYDYLVYRLTMGESLSFVQRFGFLLNLSLADMVVGIKDATVLPEVGIHNGVLYIIAVAGAGGVAYILALLYWIARQATLVGLAGLVVSLILALMMQNGGVFTPGKITLFSLVLLPLACGRSLFKKPQQVQHGF